MNKYCNNNDLIITFENESTEIKIEEKETKIDMDGKLNITTPTNHNQLLGLDYEEAGHTGFTPSRLNLLADVESDVSNSRLNILVNVDDVASKMTLSDLQKRIIRSVNGVMPTDLQVGQYILEKIEEE